MRIALPIILMFFLIISCSEKQEKKQNAFNLSITNKIEVDTYVINPTTFRKQIFSSGRVICSDHAPIFFDKNGTVKKVYVENGQFVKKGALIAKLDCKKDSMQLQVAADRIEMAQLEYENLLLGRGLSKLSKDSAQDLKRSLKLQSGLIGARTNRKLKKMQYESNFLYAPQSGTISGLSCKENHKINASESIGMILNLNNFKIDLFLMEDDWKNIEKGQKIEAFSPSLKDTLKATITVFDRHVSEDGMFHVTADVINQKTRKILHNMNVNVLCGKTVPGVISIPKGAVVRKNERDVVFTLNGNVARWNDVQITDQNRDYYLIGAGLQYGDSVIISNNLLLDDGSRVKVKKN